MTAGGKLIEDEAEGEEIGLDGGLAGDELLRSHVGDGATPGGVGGAEGRSGTGGGMVGGIELDLFQLQAAGETEVEDFDESALSQP